VERTGNCEEAICPVIWERTGDLSKAKMWTRRQDRNHNIWKGEENIFFEGVPSNCPYALEHLLENDANDMCEKLICMDNEDNAKH
jgi:hypothetical protein